MAGSEDYSAMESAQFQVDSDSRNSKALLALCVHCSKMWTDLR